jgi:energy-coupling factor transporter ATP-binding protein EcfA2
LPIASQFGFGLALASDLAVPGAIDRAAAIDAPVVRIALAPAVAQEAEPLFELDGEAIVYRNPAGTFRCTLGRIDISPADPPDLADLGTLLVANALPAVLWQRGHFMLHAACVRLTDGLTIAIAGHSGSGKSRLAASMVEAGAELIGDDSLAVVPSDHGVIAAGLPGGWFVRSPGSVERPFRQVPPGPSAGSARLDLLAVLGPGEPATDRCAPIEALELLMQHRHRPQVPLLLGRQGRVLSDAARIARDLPVIRLPACDGTEADVQANQDVLVRLADKVRCDRQPR